MEDHKRRPNCCAGTVRLRRSDFEQFKHVLGSKLVEPGFSWNEIGELWVSVAQKEKAAGVRKAVLNKCFKVVDQIVGELNRIRHEPSSKWPLNSKGKPASWGFRIHGDLICQKAKPKACLGRIEMV